MPHLTSYRLKIPLKTLQWIVNMLHFFCFFQQVPKAENMLKMTVNYAP